MENNSKVSIRPGVSILSILKHIQYDPWYALAEFVDNAIASYLRQKDKLKELEGENFVLKVYVDFNDNDNQITIRDNAAGIHAQDYARAFRAAEIPPDNSGLSEFGMGMKSAACWFSDYWRVKTSALGEIVEKTVTFDLNKIFYDKLEELDVETAEQTSTAHYTIMELFNINKMPIKKTRGKIKDHLASIYRHFLRQGDIWIFVDNEPLEYEDPKILKSPYPHESTNPPILWKKEIDFDIDEGKMYVKGFVGLLETMSTVHNGFSLFRRGRVIEGSGDDGFKPREIMGDVGSPEYKRIFGELHLEGFNVSFTKKGIKWDENMDIFLDLLKKDLATENFLKQAKDYRVRPSKLEMIKAAESVVQSTANNLSQNIQPVINDIRSRPIPEFDNTDLTKTEETIIKEFEIDFNDTKWVISLELSHDPAIMDWLEVGSHILKNKVNNTSYRQVGVRMSMSNPFVAKFAGTDKSKLEPILRVAAAIGLAEEAAREAGLKMAGTIRMNINKLIMSLSKS